MPELPDVRIARCPNWIGIRRIVPSRTLTLIGQAMEEGIEENMKNSTATPDVRFRFGCQVGRTRWWNGFGIRRSIQLGAVLAIAMVLCQTGEAEVMTAAKKMVDQSRVLVIAHRGASAENPENTLPSFQAAGEAGPDLIELDYYHSKDGVPVVFHDKTLDRTTNAIELFAENEIPVESLPLKELKRLDAGAWFGAQFAGTTIPTLEEAIAVIQPRSMTLIERKHGDAETCVRLLDRLSLKDQVVVQSFDWDYLTDCRDLDATLVLGALGSDELTEEKIQAAIAIGARVVGWNAKHLTAENIQLAKQRGLRVWAYTVNDAERARELIKDGIDGIITDRPAMMKDVVSAAAQPAAQ